MARVYSNRTRILQREPLVTQNQHPRYVLETPRGVTRSHYNVRQRPWNTVSNDGYLWPPEQISNQHLLQSSSGHSNARNTNNQFTPYRTKNHQELRLHYVKNTKPPLSVPVRKQLSRVTHATSNTTRNSIKEKSIEKRGLARIWSLYSWTEKRNILAYITGIMFYKFGLEAFNGSIISLATNRYDLDAFNKGEIPKTFERIGLMIGLNQACQCIGSIIITPIIKHCSTRIVLTISILLFAIFSAVLLIIDASTGGKIKPSNFWPMHPNDYSYYGNYNTNTLIPIYSLTGVVYGMVELIRRIIPQDIVGDDEEKLQRMDALVHIFYEVAGVSGALMTALVLIPRLGNNYSFLLTPILFTLAAFVWMFMSISRKNHTEHSISSKRGYLVSFFKGIIHFGQSILIGAKLIFTNRKYFWLFPSYTLTLYVHRYIENGLAPQIAKRYLNNSAWSQIIVGGSNFGELIGAICVFIFTKRIHSPILWLRFDCLLLLITWYIPFYRPTSVTIGSAWLIALTFIPFGFGAACDDVSLNAYLQSTITESQIDNENVSALGSVVAFLYSSYIILYGILNPLLGKYVDNVFYRQQTIRPALIFTAGLQISIISFLVFLSTFIPRGSFKINPSLK